MYSQSERKKKKHYKEYLDQPASGLEKHQTSKKVCFSSIKANIRIVIKFCVKEKCIKAGKIKTYLFKAFKNRQKRSSPRERRCLIKITCLGQQTKVSWQGKYFPAAINKNNFVFSDKLGGQTCHSSCDKNLGLRSLSVYGAF